MNTDFHYYATFLAARCAGWGMEDSKEIAHAAQYVDDCTDDQIKSIPSFVYEGKAHPSIQTCQTTQELTLTMWVGDQAAQNIWIPFHFLPGNYTSKNDSKTRMIAAYNGVKALTAEYNDLFKILTLPKSYLVESMVNDLANMHKAKDYSNQMIGLRMHVLADTYAHAFFAGACTWYSNDVTNSVIDENYGKIPYGLLGVWSTPPAPPGPTYNSRFYLGHGRMGHIPDYSFCNYDYLPQWNSKKGYLSMQHRESFLAAFGIIFQALYCVKNQVGFDTERPPARIEYDIYKRISKILNYRFDISKDCIDSDNIIERSCRYWKQNWPGNRNDIDALPEYNIDLYKNQYKSSAQKDQTLFSHFQHAANLHFDFVKEELDLNNIKVLKRTKGNEAPVEEQLMCMPADTVVADAAVGDLLPYKIDTDYDSLFEHAMYYERDAPAGKFVVTDIQAGIGKYEWKPGYERLEADLNKGAGGEYIYLFYKREPVSDLQKHNAITDITFIGKNDTTPKGYFKIDLDLSKGAGGEYIYLCYEKDSSKAPILDLMVIDGESADIQPGVPEFVRCEKDLNSGAGGKYVYLCYKKPLGYISEINIVTGDKKDIPIPPGFEKLPCDLKRGAGGKYIYLCYKRSDDRNRAITNIAFTNNTPPPGFDKIDVNINEGTHGNHIYLCYKRNISQTPIMDLLVINGNSSKIQPSNSAFIRYDVDLNKGAGGDYIYLCYRPFCGNSLQYISEITAITGDTAYIYPSADFYKLPLDMNKGAGGKYIYLCYKRDDNVDNAITDIVFTDGGAPAGYTKVNVDLNKDTGGRHIYLCYKKDITKFPIEYLLGIDGSNAEIRPPQGFDRINLDLNKGAKGKYIYLCYKKYMP